ncbi:MAG: hypothetical protein IPP10_15455 [Candidatus Competibacteraceae bacterium]|nr:hypothetical protein [Candidatus Competibacteraceae bacterium]
MAVDVEGLVNSNWTRAVNRAESIAATTQSLVTFASNVMSTFQPNFPTDAFKLDRVNPLRDPTAPLPAFTWYPTISAPNFPQTPAPFTINEVDIELKAIKPELEFPTFNYRHISELPSFTGVAPDIDSEVDIPALPQFGTVAKPNLIPIDPNDYHLDRLVVPPFLAQHVDYESGTTLDFSAAFTQGQAALSANIDDTLVMLDEALPGLSIQYQALSARVNGVLNREETALGADFDAALFEELRQKVENSTRGRLKELDDARSGGWQMPGAARFAAQRQIEVVAQQASNQAALQVFLERRKTELQHLQFVMSLCRDLIGTLGSLIGTLHNNHLEAYKAALSYASEAVRYSQSAYELMQKDAQVRIAVMEAEIRLFEAELKAQIAKVEILKTEFSFSADINDQLIKQYEAELSAEETLAKLYAAQIAGLEALIRARLIPLGVYEAKVKAYTALAEAKKAEYGIVMAEIEGDKARLSGEQAKLTAYETEVRAYATTVDAKAKLSGLQVDRARLVLDEFKTLVSAELDRIKADTEISGQTLDAYKAKFQAYSVEQQTAISGARLEFDAAVEAAKLQLMQLQFGYDRELKTIELEMERKKAVADVNGDMARVMGSMANAAQSALTNVLSAGVTQSV